MEGRDLEASELLRRTGIRLEHSKQAAFAQDDELAVGQDAGAAAINIGRGATSANPSSRCVPT